MRTYNMVLSKLSTLDRSYRDIAGNEDITGFDVYSQVTDDKIGSVKDIILDDSGNFRYFIVDLGFWIFGKNVLLPVGRAKLDYKARRIYVLGLTKEQAEHLPEYKDDMQLDYDYEERVRNVYRSHDTSARTPAAAYDRNTYNYQQDASLFNLNEQNHQSLKLYEERLIAHKSRVKTGEVTVGKHVETETARVSVPIEKERVVIERNTPSNAGTPVSVGDADFREGEVARIEVYEETPNIHKEAFVREEVRVRKEVEHDTVEAQETVRREELDIDTDGGNIINKTSDRSL